MMCKLANAIFITINLIACTFSTSAYAQTTTLSSGGADSWNTGTWSAGVPTGGVDAVIATGIAADVNNAATPAYSGSLTLETGSSLTIQNTVSAENSLGSGPITMTDATLTLYRDINIVLPAISVNGNCTFDPQQNNNDRTFSGTISGSGELRVIGRNNEYLYFSASNSLAGGLVFDNSGTDRCAAFFTTPGAGGAGDVTVIPRTTDNRYTWLILNASDVFADTATLTLAGVIGVNGNMRTTSNSQLLIMNSNNDTINKLFVNGFPYPAGTYSSVGTSATVDYEVAWINGNGVLTVLNDAAVDTNAPTVTFDAPTNSVYPGEPITYTVTFSEPHEPDLASGDLENGVPGGISVKSVVKNGETNYTVVVSALEAGTLQLRIKSGTAINDLFGNALVTPAADNDSLTVDALPFLGGQLGVWKPWVNGGINPATTNAWRKGDQYRLLFVTTGTTNANSADIEYYNSFVQSIAASSTNYPLLGSATWKAVGSTLTVDARDNTGTNPFTNDIDIAIIALDGESLIAGNNADLWNNLLSGAPKFDQNGIAQTYGSVATGTGKYLQGTKNLTQYLGSGGNICYGRCTETGANWMEVYNGPAANAYPYYAMSGILTVQDTSPAGTVIILR